MSIRNILLLALLVAMPSALRAQRILALAEALAQTRTNPH